MLPLVKQIIDGIVIITTNEVILNLRASFQLFLDKNVEFYVYIEPDSSNFYFTAQLLDMFESNSNFQGFITIDNEMNFEEIQHLTIEQLDDPKYKFTETERRAFALRKKGIPPIAICARLGKSESAIRSVWRRMRAKIERFGDDFR